MTKTLLVIGCHWPEPNATAAGVRLLQLLSFFKAQAYQITFVAAMPENVHVGALQDLGIQTRSIALNSSSFDLFITELNPDVALFDRFITEEQFGWRVAVNCPDALRILDTEDLHSLRHVRQEAFKKGEPFTVNAWLQEDKTKREIASIYRCDISLLISRYELELLQDELQIDSSLLLHLPFMVAEKEIPISLPSFEERTDFVFIGGGKHAPNVDAIKYLKQDIWPKIKATLPKTKLNMYGAYLPQQINEMHDPKSGFLIQGRAITVEEVMLAHRVCLAPLRFGAGIKGKLLHAMQFGTPSVTTAIGAEGMHEKLEWNGIIAKDTADFIKAAIHLYQDSAVWNRAQNHGTIIIKELYRGTVLEKALADKLQGTAQNLTSHRRKNFIGSMLQHQTMASSKYMGKWIEEKNKDKPNTEYLRKN